MEGLHVLHIENNATDIQLVQMYLGEHRLPLRFSVAQTKAEYLEQLNSNNIDLIFSDSGVRDLSGKEALHLAKELKPQTPFVFVSNHFDETEVLDVIQQGATDWVRKDQLWRLVLLTQKLKGVKRESQGRSPIPRIHQSQDSAELLISVIQELSLAQDLPTITRIVRRAARQLTGADGATFVLREGDLCYYADEDAISPLWKGQRFPKDICIGGWCMDNKQQVIIEDVYGDARIPYAAYQPTFIKSLVMVPIRTQDPIGAIGNYWAKPHRATPTEVRLLQSLADTTAVAIENIQAHQEIEQRVNAKTEQLQAMNHDLESFAYTLSHDLRSPLTAILGFSNLLLTQYAETNDQFLASSLGYIKHGADRINQQIDDVLSLYRLTKKELNFQAVNLSILAQEILDDLQKSEPERSVEYQLEADLWVQGDPILLLTVLENLLLNAWKYSSKKSLTSIKVGRMLDRENKSNNMGYFFVEDHGAGFDMNYAQNLFQPFQRLHTQNEFVGSGIGLASVKRIVQNHGGKIWAEAEEEQGATFYFSLPCPMPN